MNRTVGCRVGVLLVCAALAVSCGSDSTAPSETCRYSVTPLSLQPCMWATQVTATVTTTSSCKWTATPSASWMTITQSGSVTGPGTITVSVTNNWEAPRSGVVTVRGPGSTEGQDVHVSQAGCYYSVTPASFSFRASGGSGSFDVLQMSDPNTCGGPLQDACVWTAVSDASWIKITSGMPQTGDQQVRFTVERNTTGASRTGTITVHDKVVQIAQSAT